MSERIKNIVTVILFLAVIFGFAAANVIAPDKEISVAERRTLARAPVIDAAAVRSGEAFDSLEEYMPDQFVLRDIFRTFKAFNEYCVFLKKDNNDIYIADGYVSKAEYPLNEELIRNAAAKFDEYGALFEGKSVYYSVIPDKNYFLAAGNGYPCMDYERLVALLGELLREPPAEALAEALTERRGYVYADIFGCLSAGDYYRCDLHWRQQDIIPVADRLLEAMGRELPAREYESTVLSPFYGSFFGQAALPLKPDELVFLSNGALDGCTLYNPVSGGKSGLYDTDAFSGIDPYDVFLSGAEPLLIIENPRATEDGTLYLFRDSFGSSIAPLLAESYSRIVLIDMRYISAERVKDYIDTQAPGDVLFLLSAIVLNRSNLFR